MSLTPAQCRAARALIDWSREDLSRHAGVAVRTISDFEAGRRDPINATMTSMRSALEAAGVEFIPENGGGSGVRFKRKSDH
ncbi:helix-turn-helix transcriptional regulator [Xanthobacter sp. KR7-225]|uniref:helix-turn-helix domain-containing protein n=1 Tax=Xanthobacter sp. KR7-225 TaxID=3156613 RepID=UPI0032B512B0